MMRYGDTMHVGMRQEASLCARFLSKIVIDVLPAAIASGIGGFLITQYQFGHTAVLRPATEQALPASAEMMKLVHDEHAMIVDYLKAQMATEKARQTAEDEADARAVADANTAAATPEQHVEAAAVASQPVPSRGKAVAAVALPVRAPLAIALAEQNPGVEPVGAPERAPDSLLAKTLDIKDHVVHAAFHAVSVIGGIPSWIASMGDHAGG